MDNNYFFGYYNLPGTLGLLLTQNTDTMDLFTNMDDLSRTELMKRPNDFQSKEELERYIYHLQEDKTT